MKPVQETFVIWRHYTSKDPANCKTVMSKVKKLCEK